MATTKATAVTSPPGVIEPGRIYRLDEFLGRVGWKRAAMRTARREGLRVISAGGRAFVAGDDAIAYLTGRDGAN